MLQVWQITIDKITTNHTFFMREADHFFYLRDKVLPFFADTIRDKDLRMWCAACSTGEESYTLAMLVDDFFGKEKVWWDAKVLASLSINFMILWNMADIFLLDILNR